MAGRATPAPGGSVSEAVDAGRQALRHGDRSAAVQWFDRAQRLAPHDASVTFLLAAALAGQDDTRSLDLFRHLVAMEPMARGVRIALVAATLRAGTGAEAVEALRALLLDFAVPSDRAFAAVADRACVADGRAGWCGLGVDGQLLVSAPATGVLAVTRGRTRRYRGRRPELLTLPGQVSDGVVTVTLDGVALIGSGLDPRTAEATVGCVEQDATGDLVGWACTPWNPDRSAALVVETGNASFQVVAADAMVAQAGGLTVRRGFRLSRGSLPVTGPVHVRGLDGRDLVGSPVFPVPTEKGARAGAALLATVFPLRGPAAPCLEADRWRPLPVAQTAPAPETRPVPRRRSIDVVIPVYRRATDLVACLAALRRNLVPGTRIVLVDDASPEPDLVAALDVMAAAGEVVLLRHAANQGFPAAANTGLRHAGLDPRAPRDVLLLNADTLPPAGLPERLAAIAYRDPSIGSVTPLSTDSSIVSVFPPGLVMEMPTRAALDVLDSLAVAANPGGTVDLPTAVGFCMFIRHDCLDAVGVLRDDAFAQGYGEENDWCLRARLLGWRHVAATGIVVAHAGSRSFGAAKQALMERNGRVLERLHPGYNAMVALFEAEDRLAPVRRAIEAAGWPSGALPGGAVVLVSHALAGGVLRFLLERCERLRQAGLRPVVVTPAPGGCQVADGAGTGATNLVYRLPRDWTALQALLSGDRPRWVELHHLLGHGEEVATLPSRLGVPFDVFVHDFHLWCPRVTLCGPARQYCGQPDTAACEACVQVAGSRIEEVIGVAALRQRSLRLVRGARRVIAPSRDAAERFAQYMPGLRLEVQPWESEPALAPLRRRDARLDRDFVVVVPGGIGVDKGYDVLLACAWDARERRLPIRFVVAGHTMDDETLLRTGTVFVTGAFAEAEAVGIVQAQDADLGFVPSVWPETWCYTLSALLKAGLAVATFDLGAQAERVRAAGRGFTMPLGLPPARINDRLLQNRPAAVPTLEAAHV